MNKVLKCLPLGMLFTVSQVTASRAFAWADLGHSIVGAVAEENLTPKAKDFVRGVLGVEPLATAAVWPDHVRDDERFGHKAATPEAADEDIHDFGNFHFCEIPTGFTYETKPKKDIKDCNGAIKNAVELLKNPLTQTPREAKMIALRYLVHVVGDVHQPLHVGNGFDRGGNACMVHWRSSQNTTNLHAVWDDGLVQFLGTTYADPSTVPPIRSAVYMGDFLKSMKRLRPEMFTAGAKAQAAAGGLNAWLAESQALREAGLYPDNKDQMKNVPKGEEPKHRPYCSWFSDQDRGTLGAGSPVPGAIRSDVMPLLDDAYAKANAKIVETQLLKAGLRLAAMLDDIAATATAPQATLDQAKQEAVIKMVQDSFRNE